MAAEGKFTDFRGYHYAAIFPLRSEVSRASLQVACRNVKGSGKGAGVQLSAVWVTCSGSERVDNSWISSSYASGAFLPSGAPHAPHLGGIRGCSQCDGFWIGSNSMPAAICGSAGTCDWNKLVLQRRRRAPGGEARPADQQDHV